MNYTDEAVENALTEMGIYWSAMDKAGREMQRKLMRRALSAADAQMEAAGWVRVPVKPTWAMIDDAQRYMLRKSDNWSYTQLYRAMIAARPTTEKQP
ncbi:MAG: hypothetical protein E6Q97_03535 [Desulfurellales bacterium]|nr:MAG: hypothetical protein E6Q97_03535 [Desulfurellales bacterium]